MEESNPWPTFVDAFSTVLCIFIFLMLVFVLNSMLIMYESSKKSYEAPALIEQIAKSSSSTVAKSGGATPDQQNLKDTSDAAPSPATASNSQSESAQAQQQPAALLSESEMMASASSAEASQANVEGSASDGEKTMQANADENKKGEVIRLADNQTAASIKGQNSGRFDSQDTPPVWVIKGNQFVIHFKGLEQGYPAEAIEEVNKWLGVNKPLVITVYAHPTESIAVSDAMRLAYERGVILLKILKGKYPRDEISISVVNESTMLSNSAVITRSE
ncbi:TPA: hypothetical protein QCJ61_001297 [Enterobacter asburiae]|nr:hypothetical protein [Enterobacter asburiae]HDR2803530.1 hypothetical protein [Enterobacter asburiae]HDR2809629.1 hypothetical protein [Enterobacter asburiae]HDR2814231.1 hypothetical protein [Enterobacter asburiae]